MKILSAHLSRKVLHRSLECTVANGLAQTAEYMDRCGADAGHLVIFDRDESRTWADKLFHRRESAGPVPIEVWACKPVARSSCQTGLWPA